MPDNNMSITGMTKSTDDDEDQSLPTMQPNQESTSLQSLITMEELEMFQLVRQHLEAKDLDYNDFLKTIHLLYTSGVCDAEFLVQQIQPYIGDDAYLFDWFKSILGLQESRRTSIQPTITSNDTKASSSSIKKADHVDECTTSYRYASKEWKEQPCTGKDALCHEVLNNDYVSHPIWQREDSDFPATKKNLHEQEMHGCEEERHKYDSAIDINASAVAYLESMMAAAAGEFAIKEEKLELNSITKSAIKRVYDSPRAQEVLDMLQKYPVQIAPIVIKRLRQKGGQWKRKQYELLPIWRERDAKNYYRALDYAALTFRTVDRKATTPQKILQEIKKKDGHWIFDYGEDMSVMQDVVHVILSYATRHHAIVDRDVIRGFLQRFLPWLFGMYNVSELQSSSFASSSSFSNTINNDTTTTTTSSSPSQQQQPTTRSSKSSSPRPLYVYVQQPSSSSSPQQQPQQHYYHPTPSSPSSSHSTAFTSTHTLHDHNRPIYLNHSTPLATPPSSDHVDFDIDDGSKHPLILDNSDDDSLGQRSPYSRSSSPISFSPPGTTGTTFESPYRSGYPKSTCLFCNEDFYCFIRYYQILYERLLYMKNLTRPRYVNSIARKLKMDQHLPKEPKDRTHYEECLDAVDKLFGRKIGAARFEEKLRSLYSVEAYPMFTIDRLTIALIKSIIAFDAKTKEALKDQTKPVFFQEFNDGIQRQFSRVVAQNKGLYEINVDHANRRLAMTDWSAKD
ncbi:sin3p-rpd3p histone-deacetylase dna binding [Lichtheimia corymbifera JMRC:FSU:9682]|uniref:Sin3p-rpd3p histone-deacetylase dna binding n=1 Tax=Lichtheimia corymbifera JMRC:FSU:9682 TaxID=1263082 RepID=A0A068SEH8_9FUNG|nr:sin3p-rpd3p histone-deacetylase dna binding [Lichtheimia corymbifera JMRC:FSU:9682]